MTWCQETHPVCQLIALMSVKNTAREIKNLKKKKKVQFKHCQAPCSALTPFISCDAGTA